MIIKERYHKREPRLVPGQYDLEFLRQYNYEESKHFKINHYPSQKKPAYFRWEYNDEPFYSPIIYKRSGRYNNIKIMKELGKSYHTTNRLRGIKYTDNDSFHIVTNETENRLDKISQLYYNTPIYWWIIAHANNIFDSLTEVVRDRQLRIPPLSSIQNYYLK